MAITAAQLAAYIKERYPSDAMKIAMYASSPFLGLVNHTRVTGLSWSRTIQYGVNQSTSALLSTAINNSGRSRASKFTKSTDALWPHYTVFTLEGLAMAIAPSAGDGSMVDVVDNEIDAALMGHNGYLGFQAFRAGGGALGQIENNGSYPITGAVAKLINVEDAHYFDVGMVVELDDTTGDARTGAVRSGTLTVSAVNREAGLVTFSANINTVSEAAVNDYIFRKSDFAACINGLSAWHPWTAPTSGDSFFGIDRSVDVQKHCGSRVAAGNLTKREALIEAISKAGKHQPANGPGLANMVTYFNPTDYQSLLNELESTTYQAKIPKGTMTSKFNASVSYSGVQLETGWGPVLVLNDPYCPVGHAFMVDPTDYEFVYSAYEDKAARGGDGPMAHIDQSDGNLILRATTSDAFEGRIKSYTEMVCKRPSRAVHINFAATALA
jgi:hypothetical protein